ncbi:MAG TPA: nucleotidyl transferase AbiEii/AbiGii toxin family protein [Actinomycetota bacterium]
MTPREVRNVAASVRQRLLDRAREHGFDFNFVLARYAAERFLYRLGTSSEVDRFTLKGASLLLLWAGTELRPTRDVDLLGSGPADHAAVGEAIARICGVESPDDGLVFDTDSIRVVDIRDDQEYDGVRVKLVAFLDKARIPVQVDIGFGDAITPQREQAQYPTLLDAPAPIVWTYPRETFVAEKFEAMVRFGATNSRMKDFWDVAAVAGRFAFAGETLAEAVAQTFERRGSSIMDLPVALRPAFYQERERVQRWEAFQQTVSDQTDVPARFDAVGEIVRAFLGPVRESVAQDSPLTSEWPAGGSWLPTVSRTGEGGRRG